jgi:hypothetical protein
MPELLLTHGTWRVDFVTKDEERDFAQFLNGEERF